MRKGTASGYSPRMRLDLIINTMFACAMRDGQITVHNPSIWRPIISIEDAASAYMRAIEANERMSGIFNVASGNYTVGEAADQVKTEIEESWANASNSISTTSTTSGTTKSVSKSAKCAQLPSPPLCSEHRTEPDSATWISSQIGTILFITTSSTFKALEARGQEQAVAA